MNHDAIIIIPGLDSKKAGFALDRLIKKLSDQVNVSEVKMGKKTAQISKLLS